MLFRTIPKLLEPGLDWRSSPSPPSEERAGERRPSARTALNSLASGGRGLLLLFTLAACLFASGCAEVKPWERGTLAEPIMRADRDPLGDMQKEHLFLSREQALGGRAVGGGGCGCN